MDCQRARQLIDERLDAMSAAPSESAGNPQVGGPELDAHLAACPACAAEWREITRARELVAEVAKDAPTAREVDAMWAAVQLGISGVATAGGMTLASVGFSETPANLTRRWWLWRFVAASSAIAATLAIALILGADRYGVGIGRVIAAANLSGVGRSAMTYANEDRHERFTLTQSIANNDQLWPVPAFDKQYASNQQPRTDASWTQLNEGEVAGTGYISPSADLSLADTLQTVSVDSAPSIPEKEKVTFGYQVPSGWPASTNLDASPDVHGKPLASLGYVGTVTSGDDATPNITPGQDNLQGTTQFAGIEVLIASDFEPTAGQSPGANANRISAVTNLNSLGSLRDVNLESRMAMTADKSASENPPIATASPSDWKAFNSPNHVGRGAGEGQSVLVQDGHSSFERTPIVGVDQNNLDARPGRRGSTAFDFGQPKSESIGDDRVAEMRTEAPSPAQESPPNPPSGVPAKPDLTTPNQSKIIKTGELGLEVPAHDEAVTKVETIARQGGGFIADASTQEQSGGALLGKIVIRVLPERFEALFAALKSVGRVEAENVKAADVTAEYVDLEARIKGLQITEERLQELIKNKSLMDKVSSLLEVEREVTRVRTDIEKLQGQLRVMADRIGLSTITVTLREPARTVPSASLSVEVPIVEDAAGALGKSLESLGGRLLSGKISKRNDGTLMGEYQFTVSLARFGELLAAIEGLGRVHERQVKDRQFSDASAPWADKVKCGLGLTLFERSRQLPSATVRVEVEGLEAAMKALDAPLAESSGAVVSNQTTRQNDGSSSADLKLRVPAGQFTRLLDALAPLGRTVSKQIGGEAGRIVGGAASVPCEISLTLAEKPRQVPSGSMAVEVAAFEPARTTLSTIIKEKGVQVLGSGSSQRTDGTWLGGFRLAVKAADMDALVGRLESLGRVSSRQINGIGLGDLSRADPNALGVIELTLGEKSTIAPAPERAGDSIRQRLRDGLAGLYTSLGLIAYGLVVMAPWLLIVLGAGWLIMRRVKRGRNTSLAAPIAAPPALGKGA